MKVFISLLFIFSKSILIPCECVTIGYSNDEIRNQKILKENFKNSPFIFYGEYVDGKTFKIKKLFKGHKLINQNNLLFEKEEISTCDYFFEENKSYLVFGSIDENKKLNTSSCKANKEITDAKQLDFIKNYLN